MYHVIINPASHSGQGLKLWKKYESSFRSLKEPVEIHYSLKAGDITRICRELTAPVSEKAPEASAEAAVTPPEMIHLVIFGGDGSMNEAANGILDFSRVILGMIPTGSGNDLARDLIPGRTTDRLVASILHGETLRTIDLGEVCYHDEAREAGSDDAACGSTHRFFVGCGIGYDAAVCENVNTTPLKKVFNLLHLGGLTYLAVAIRQIFIAPLRSCEICFDPGTPKARTQRFSRLLFSTGMNHRYQGGGFKFCPDADDQDGLLDFCTAADLIRAQFFYIFPSAYSGKHYRYRQVSGERAAAARIRTEVPLWVQTDGEVSRKSKDITIRILPSCLKLMI